MRKAATYLFSDPEGVRLTFNSSGTVTSGATYNPYGQITAGGISGITPFGYAGGYTDPTGLVYLVNRYYDPSTGQFLSVDPLAGITGEPYQYVNGDPLNFTDPLGLKICWQALELGLTSASRQCWKSGYKKAGHDVTHRTVGVCAGAHVAFGYGGEANICIGFVHGHFHWWGTLGFGGGSPSAGFSLGPMFSNATSPCQLGKWFAFSGTSAGEGLYGVGAEGAVGNGGIWTFEPEWSPGFRLLPIPIPFESHGGTSYTWVR